MANDVQAIGAAYDHIAASYDDQWSVYVAAPQRRLTRGLSLALGQRCADLGCGTGVDTLEMLQRVAPGEVVAVDPSPGMLETASQRARAVGLELTTCCEGADHFIEQAAAESFDVVSLRFCLGYLDWRSALPRLPRLLRRGGRLGILTILSRSAPQAYDTYREMAEDYGAPAVELTALDSREEIEAQLQHAGAEIHESWTHSFRLSFATGLSLARWLQISGVATHPMLSALSPGLSDALWSRFAERVESRRDGLAVPLDFHLAGVIAGR